MFGIIIAFVDLNFIIWRDGTIRFPGMLLVLACLLPSSLPPPPFIHSLSSSLPPSCLPFFFFLCLFSLSPIFYKNTIRDLQKPTKVTRSEICHYSFTESILSWVSPSLLSLSPHPEMQVDGYMGSLLSCADISRNAKCMTDTLLIFNF